MKVAEGFVSASVTLPGKDGAGVTRRLDKGARGGVCSR
jgi:hypothetical protein